MPLKEGRLESVEAVARRRVVTALLEKEAVVLYSDVQEAIQWAWGKEMTSRSICAGYTVDRRTVSAVMDPQVKEQKAQLLTVHTALNPAAGPADSEDPMDGTTPTLVKVVLVTVPGVTAEDERVRRVLGRWSQLQAEKAETVKKAMRRQSLLACEGPVEATVIRLLGVMVVCFEKAGEAPAEATVEQVLAGSPAVRWLCLYGHQKHPEVVEKEEVSEEVRNAWLQGLEKDLSVLNVALSERTEE